MLIDIVSLLFYITFVLYLFQGIYGLSLNRQAALNKIFFCLCLSFSLWSLAFAVSNQLTDLSEVLIWRRIAALGWGIAFSLILHFVLILTQKENRQLSRWILIPLYLPSVVTIFVFSLNGDLANTQYQLVLTSAGWGNIPLNNGWDIFYNLYYMTFSVMTLGVLFKWVKNESDSAKKIQGLGLLFAFVVTLILATLTEMVANTSMNIKIPSVAPIFILIPVSTFALMIRKYGLMNPQKNQQGKVRGDILGIRGHGQFVRAFAFVYGLVGILTASQNFFYPSDMLWDMAWGFVYIFLGLAIYLLPPSGLSLKNQDRFLTLIILLSCPLTIYLFWNSELNNVLWSVPILYLLVAVIFNLKNMHFILSLMSAVIGLLICLFATPVSLPIGTVSHLARLIIVLIAIILSRIINRIYVARIRENDLQIHYQKMIADISVDFVSVTHANFDEKVNALLGHCGLLTRADRAYLGLFNEDLQTLRLTHQWQGETAQAFPPEDRNRTIFPFNREQLFNHQLAVVQSRDSLPPEAQTEQADMEKHGVLALVQVPVYKKGQIIGCLCFEQLHNPPEWEAAWDRDDLEKLRLFANILGNAFLKLDLEYEKNNLAYYDSLTGLPNRNLFYQQLNLALKTSKESSTSLGVIFVDIDGFKEINDTEGHEQGDHLLKQIASRLSACVQNQDLVARFGGDEFLILVPQIDPTVRTAKLTDITDDILTQFKEPIALNDQSFHITASGGISVYPEDGKSVNDLIKHADLAMYSAKHNGKGQFAFCSNKMKEEVIHQTRLTNALHKALERNEFFLHYQPQVSLETGAVIGFEALLRWHHPEMGLIPPGVFIPLAEKAGLIEAIGEWVLLEACTQNKAWQEQGFKPLPMGVNLSMEQFRTSQLVNTVRNCLKKTGLRPEHLELEITEGIAMKESSFVINCLRELKALGVIITIDDFGTEFSSLSRLKELPVDRLKIDMEFVRGIGKNPKDESLISVMVLLCKRLGLKIIAEGGETEAQVGFLKEAGCSEVQGYYFYKPLSKEEIENQTGILLETGNKFPVNH
jgi:diguanylate cyclase (GGDEF)-like protein